MFNSIDLMNYFEIASISLINELRHKISKQCDILTSVNSDEPMQPPFMRRNSKWRSVSSLTFIVYSSD